MLTFVKNDKATLYATFENGNGQPEDPSPTPQVTIYYQGAVKLGPVDLIKIDVGLWYYNFTIPDSYVPGNYAAVYDFFLGGFARQSSESFEVVESITPVPPAPSTVYCTPADVLLWLTGVDLSLVQNVNNVIASLIPIKENEIDSACHQTFKVTSVTWNFNGSGSNRLVFPWRPIVGLTYMVLRVIPQIQWYAFVRPRFINVNRLGVDVTTMSPDDTDADLYIDANVGVCVIPPRILYMEQMAVPFWNYTFLDIQGTYNVRASLTYGFKVTPADITQACAKKVAIEVMGFAGNKLSGGATDLDVDDFKVKYKGSPYSDRINLYSGQIETIMNRYRRQSW